MGAGLGACHFWGKSDRHLEKSRSQKRARHLLRREPGTFCEGDRHFKGEGDRHQIKERKLKKW